MGHYTNTFPVTLPDNTIIRIVRIVAPYRAAVSHDGDGIFSPLLDRSITHMGLRVLKTPPRSPKANSLCERVIGTLRRECLDFLIPLTENHLRIVTKHWVEHYNRGRPHSSLEPGIPDPPVELPITPHEHRHRIPSHCKVVAHPVLGGLHHEYSLLAKALHEFLRITRAQGVYPALLAFYAGLGSVVTDTG